ncbi:MAG: hypothetical protein WDN09_00215 [bacterium]
MVSAYAEDEKDGDVREYLKLKPSIAPVICAVVAIAEKQARARGVCREESFRNRSRRNSGRVAWDDNGKHRQALTAGRTRSARRGASS